MANNKTISFAAIALLSVVYTAGFCAEAVGLVEKKDTGTIHWATGVVQARGISTPLKKGIEKTPRNSPKALSEAKIQELISAGIREVDVLYIDMINYGDQIRNTLLLDKTDSYEDALIKIFERLRPGEPPTFEASPHNFTSNLLTSPPIASPPNFTS